MTDTQDVARYGSVAEQPTRDDLIRELARLLTEGAQAVLKRRAASTHDDDDEPQPASAPAKSRNDVR